MYRTIVVDSVIVIFLPLAWLLWVNCEEQKPETRSSPRERRHDTARKSQRQAAQLLLRSESTTLSHEEVKVILTQYGFHDRSYNPQGEGIENHFEVQQDGRVVFDYATKLMWQRTGSRNQITFAEAEKYISDLNDRRFAGYRDWRLPTIEEAMSLMENEKKDGLYINSDLFDRTQRVIWTADKTHASVAWVVDFYHAFCFYTHIQRSVSFARAVR